MLQYHWLQRRLQYLEVQVFVSFCPSLTLLSFLKIIFTLCSWTTFTSNSCWNVWTVAQSLQKPKPITNQNPLFRPDITYSYNWEVGTVTYKSFTKVSLETLAISIYVLLLLAETIKAYLVSPFLKCIAKGFDLILWVLFNSSRPTFTLHVFFIIWPSHNTMKIIGDESKKKTFLF